jgi:cytochrome d ubiquinol oxidase subunit I
LTGSDVLISLLAYMAVYLVMYPAGVLLMWRLVVRGPAAAPAEEEPAIEGGRPYAPVLAGGKVAGGGEQ